MAFFNVAGTVAVQGGERGRDLEGALIAAARLAPDPDGAHLARLLEMAADALDVERVSFWTYAPQEIVCLDLFERAPRRHSAGARIAAGTAPVYFEALALARTIDAHDARADARTREFAATYLAPLGIASMLDAPVRLNGKLAGVVCHEHVGAPRRWSADELSFASGMADLVAQSLVAAELRAERDFARTLLQAYSDLGEGVALVGRDRRLLYVNEALAKIVGYTAEEMLAFPDAIAQVMHERSRAQWIERFALLAEGKEVEPRIESFLRHRSGSPVPVEIVGVNVEHGPRSGRLYVIRDITDARRRDEVGRQLRTFVASTTDAIVTADLAGSIVAWNPGAERLFGWSAREVLGKHLHTYFPPERASESGRLAEIVAGRAVLPYETERLHKDGRRIPVNVNLTPVRGPDGELVGVTAIIRDASAQKELADARRRLAEGEKLSALGSLVSGLAHEVRTPLTYLQTNLHLAAIATRRALAHVPEEPRAKALADVERAFSEALEGVSRVERLVEDLRRYTRLRSDDNAPRVPLHAAVAEAVEIFRVTQRSLVGVEAEVRPTPTVRVDAFGVQQVVLNLLQNAAEAGPRDGVVRVRTGEEGDAAVLVVEDRGAGMSPEVRARVFETFFTTKSEGTGLGMSIVKRIVDGHGARIDLESAAGEGTRVRVAFPRRSSA